MLPANATAALRGSGAITADGGSDTDCRGGGGGGGRIAIHTPDGTAYTGSLSAGGGRGQTEWGIPWSPGPTDIASYGQLWWGVEQPGYGAIGTVYLEDARTLKAGNFTSGGGRFLLGGSSWSCSGLVVSNCHVCFEFTSTPATLTVTGDIALQGGKGSTAKNTTRGGRLQVLDGIAMTCGNVTIENDEIAVSYRLNAFGGTLTVTGGGSASTRPADDGTIHLSERAPGGTLLFFE